MIANGVTSEPVPEEVGIATKYAFSPILGKVNTLFRISIKSMARSSKFTSGCSYISHIIFPASIAEPPPIAMIVSGSKAEIISAPFLAHWRVGSGATSKKHEC
jgi:hypothetical protein